MLIRLQVLPLPANQLQDLVKIVGVRRQRVDYLLDAVLEIIGKKEQHLIQKFQDFRRSPAPHLREDVIVLGARFSRLNVRFLAHALVRSIVYRKKERVTGRRSQVAEGTVSTDAKAPRSRAGSECPHC